MTDYEKLGVFYLGRHKDAGGQSQTSDLLLFESKNLVTHGLVVGMTGSGKTGLCFDIIEEAAIDGVPSVIIDPKGDLTNLLLTFPELRTEDFEPWVNVEETQKAEMTVADYAAKQAELWRNGLAAWHQDGERIRRLQAAADFAIYTPGSSAGRQVSLLTSFARPPAEVMEDMELLNERVSSTVASLLGLVGIDADPVKSRDAVLLSNLLQNAWAHGRDLDLGSLIHEIQQPGITRLGVLDLESFYPAKERFELAMRLNNLLASPNFASWMQGEPLQVSNFLYTQEGKPRVAIFSIAHLGDSERMFFVTLLLNQVLAWMRTQSGTNSLRALVYMDEIFGYFPPIANPPSKLPLLTLLKQARAFGVGVVLATQNPVDLDYKGLANIGTWFLGRLQTDRDKARVLDGLEGAAAGRGTTFNRQQMEQLLAGLAKRVFLLHSVHEEGVDTFESRWSMSYMRGPLNRAQIKSLMDAKSGEVAGVQAKPAMATAAAQTGKTTATERPALPPQVPQYFAPPRSVAGKVVYVPRLLGAAKVRFSDARLKVDAEQDVLVMTEIMDSPVPVDWAAAEDLALEVNDLEKTPVEGEYTAFAPAATQVKNYERWSKDFASWIYSARRLQLWRAPTTELVSNPGESERDFKIRVQQGLRELRDRMADELRQKYAPKIATLQERIRRAEAARERESEQARRAKMNTVISLGSTLLGAFLGRKAVSAGTVGRAATTMRGAGRAVDQAGDVTRAAETVAALEKQYQELDAQFRDETAALTASLNATAEQIETLDLKPRKTDIQVRLVALVWLPFQRNAASEELKPAW